MVIYHYWLCQGGTLIFTFISCMSYVYFLRVDAWLMIAVCLFVYESTLLEKWVYVCVAFPAWVFLTYLKLERLVSFETCLFHHTLAPVIFSCFLNEIKIVLNVNMTFDVCWAASFSSVCVRFNSCCCVSTKWISNLECNNVFPTRDSTAKGWSERIMSEFHAPWRTLVTTKWMPLVVWCVCSNI